MDQLTPLQRGHLRLALAYLHHKDVPRYRHQLWIAFGDTWPIQDRQLVLAGHVRANISPSPERAITEAGIALAESIDEAVVAA